MEWILSSIAIAIGALILWGVLEKIWRQLTKKKIVFQDKHVLITGGTKGLGKEFAKLVASKGAKVTIIARGKEALEETKKEIEALHSTQIVGLSADVSDAVQMEKVMREAILHNGVPDFVVLCAGSAAPGLMVDTSAATYRSQVEVNYLGGVFTVKAALPAMIERGTGGHVILVSSGAALSSFIGYSQYAPSKWAVRAFGDAIRNEFLLYDIQVTQFFPSNMDTPGYENEERSKPQPTKAIEGSAQLFSAEQSAKDLYAGLMAGQYQVTQELNVEMMRVALNSFNPRNFFLLESLLNPFLPLVQFFVRVFLFDSVVKRFKGTMNKGKEE